VDCFYKTSIFENSASKLKNEASISKNKASKSVLSSDLTYKPVVWMNKMIN